MNRQLSRVRVGTVAASALALLVPLLGPLASPLASAIAPAPAQAAPAQTPALAAPAAAPAAVSLWGKSRPRVTLVKNRSGGVELGTKFTAKKNGKATGVRFYKAKGMTGKHVGTLWSRSGKVLARVTFRGESASGWQTARFAKAVTLKKGTSYVVSYHVNKSAKYVRTTKAKKASTSSLSVAASGRFRTTSRIAFPTRTKNARYWVDVQFVPSAPTARAASTPSGPAVKGFPTRATTGVPAGWTPKRSYTGDYYVTDDRATLSDVRITGGNLYVWGFNVTVRNVEVVDGRIINFRSPNCYNGLTLENVSIVRKNNAQAWDPAVEAGGYTANRVKVDGWWEGLRAGGNDFRNTACTNVVVTNSWINVQAPTECWTNPDADAGWHGDALQGYMGADITIRDTYLGVNGVPPKCGGNSAFFWPDQGNGRATVQNLLVSGGGYPFRLETRGSVSGLKVVDGSWEYDSPSLVRGCPSVAWGSGNEVVRVNADGSLASVRPIGCG